MATKSGFVKGQSDNLPKIDSLSMFSFLGENPNFMGAEIRGIKAARSGRESYGDNAVGYVQVKRDGHICTVKAKITPEHSVRKKAYDVVLKCDEPKETIISVECENCAASLGGCKHAIALLTWLHRRSEEPSTTSVACYWKKSVLSTVGSSKKFVKAKDLGKMTERVADDSDDSFLQMFVNHSLELAKTDTVLTKYYKNLSSAEMLSLHYLLQIFFEKNKSVTAAEQFLSFCKNQISVTSCFEAEKCTRGQADNPLWHELRYCRITASKAYDVMHCHTPEGSLIETILGARKLKDTEALARGRRLEDEIIEMVEKKKQERNLKSVGLYCFQSTLYLGHHQMLYLKILL